MVLIVFKYLQIYILIYIYPYEYNGDYTGTTGYTESSFSMSGQSYDLDEPSELNRIWQVKRIEGHNIYLQEVDNVTAANVADQNIFSGSTATFNFNVTTKSNSDLYYRWYRVVGNKDTIENGETDDIALANNTNTLTINDNSNQTPTSDVITPQLGGTHNVGVIAIGSINLYVSGNKFYCRVYNGSNIDYSSNVATLTINTPYTLTYKSMDGTTTYKVDPNKHKKDEKVTVNFTNVEEIENYTFAGWATEANSTVATYKNSEKLTMPESNTTLYAVWVKNKLFDEPTSIELNGSFTYNSDLVVTEVEKENADDALVSLLDENKKVLGSYNITVTNGNYNGKINLSFNVGEEYNGEEVTIYHKLANGTVETKTATVDDGKANIEVNELSPFMVVINNQAKLVSNPKTFDNIISLIIIFGVSIAGIVSLIIVLNKKNKKGLN